MTAIIARIRRNRARLEKAREAVAMRNPALTSASAELAWLNGFSLAATFDGEFSDTTRSYAGKGMVRYAW